MNTAKVIQIAKLPDGGFVVMANYKTHLEVASDVRCACTSLGEALEFARGQLDPIDPAPKAPGQKSKD